MVFENTGTGWLSLGDFGKINPRSDSVGEAGRDYFTALSSAGGYLEATGDGISGGPETWYYVPDVPFFLKDLRSGASLKVVISRLPTREYYVRFEPGQILPRHDKSGGWL